MLPPSPPEPPPSAEELESVAVFPLPSVVLFPGELLPLHLFEPRYRALAHDCLEVGPRLVAMALLAPGWERDYEGRPPIHEVAGLGRIVQHRRHADGTFDLVLEGIARVRLTEHPPREAYRRARATPLVERAPSAETERALSTTLAIVSALARAAPGTSAPLPRESTAGALADVLAARYLRDVTLRQRALEALDPSARLSIVGDVLADLLAAASPRNSSA